MTGTASLFRIAALVLSAALLLSMRGAVRGADGPAGAFVGSARCASCHEGMHRTWTSGRHSRMLQPATPDTVLGDFRAGRVELRGRTYGLRAQDGRFVIRESLITGREHDRPVQYTLGSRRIQHYLTTLPDGRMVVLPPTWDVQRKQWFHNMDIVDPEETGDTPHLQVWNTNCFGCHVSNESKNFDSANNTYGTDWQDFGTGCERCHGPGQAHVARYAESPPPGGPTLIVRPTHLTPPRETMVCAQCHSLRDITAVGFTAGQDYFDHFLPILEYAQKPGADPAYWPDGRPRRFSNDALGLWQSRCFLEGGATCTTCHFDPHLPDVDRNRQLTSGADALCVSCHETLARDVAAHTRHAEGSPGRSCVACHMPETVLSIKARMRDHTIAVPVPENTARHGIPNACNEYHRDRTPEWAAGVLASWGPGPARQRLVARADAFAGGRAGDAKALPELVRLAGDGRADPLSRANAVGYLRRFPTDARSLPAAERAVGDGHPLVRAVAVLTVGELAKDPAAARVSLLPALRDPLRTVRVGAAFSLAAKGVSSLPGDDGKHLAAARADYAARGAFLSDDPGAQLDLGKFFFLGGEFDRAAQAFDATLRLRPEMPGGIYFLGLARLGQGRTQEGRARLRAVPAGDPYFEAARGVLAKLDKR
jgi:predicted CXXCH cytochrome family protein